MTLAASRRSRLAIMGGLVLALAGTAIPSTTLAQDGPEKPVLSLFTAITEKRFADIGQSFCPEFAGQASQLDIAAAMTGSLPAGVDPQVAVDALAFSVTGPGGVGEPVITVLAEDAAGTSLGVEATLLASIDPATSEPFVRAIVVAQLEAAGMEVTEENIAAFMTLVASELEGMEAFSQDISEVILVTRSDDGIWLICSPLGGSDSSPEPSASDDPAASTEPEGSTAPAG